MCVCWGLGGALGARGPGPSLLAALGPSMYIVCQEPAKNFPQNGPSPTPSYPQDLWLFPGVEGGKHPKARLPSALSRAPGSATSPRLSRLSAPRSWDPGPALLAPGTPPGEMYWSPVWDRHRVGGGDGASETSPFQKGRGALATVTSQDCAAHGGALPVGQLGRRPGQRPVTLSMWRRAAQRPVEPVPA